MMPRVGRRATLSAQLLGRNQLGGHQQSERRTSLAPRHCDTSLSKERPLASTSSTMRFVDQIVQRRQRRYGATIRVCAEMSNSSPSARSVVRSDITSCRAANPPSGILLPPGSFTAKAYYVAASAASKACEHISPRATRSQSCHRKPKMKSLTSIAACAAPAQVARRGSGLTPASPTGSR